MVARFNPRPARGPTVGATPRGCPIQSTPPNTSCFGTNVPLYRQALVHAVKTPDALQLVTALLIKCPVFLTNDRELPAVPGIRILTVQAYLSAA